MSVLLKDIGSALISSLLCKYINNVDPNQITIALGKGELTLRDVTVRESALSDHQIPFKVVASRIGQISIKIPYRYTQAPATIEVDDVDVLLNVTGNVIIESDMSAPQKEVLVKDKKEESRGFFGNMVYSVVEQIIANLRFKITNVHLRVEYESGGVLAGGLMIKEIECFTINESRERVMISTTPEVLFKELIVSGLSIYMDSETEKVNRENFQESMQALKTGPHEYVLENFGVSGILKHPREATEAANEIDVKSEKLWLQVSRKQFVAYEKMQEEIKRFNVKRYYAKCGLPDRLPKSIRSSGLWWRYAKNCALLRRNEKMLKVDVALKFLQNRESTRALFESSFEKPDDEEISQKLEELADDLGNEAYMLLMVRAKTLWRMSKVQQPNISEEELEELEKAEKFRTSGLLVDYELAEFGVKLTNGPETTCVLTLNECDGKYKKIGAEYYTSCNIANILLLDKESTHIFELMKSGDRKASEFIWSNNSVQQSTSITFQATAPKIIYKIPFIDDFNAFSKKTVESDPRFDALLAEQAQQSIQPEIKQEIEKHQTLRLNVHFDAPIVTIPTVLPIYIVLGSVDIKSLDGPARISASDVSGLYDKYDVKFRGFAVMIDEKQVCHPIDTDISFSTLFVTLPDKPKNVLVVDVDTIDVRINRLQYLACLALMDMVSPSKTADQPQEVVGTETSAPPASGFGSLSVAINFKKVELSVLDLDFSVFSMNSIDGISIQYNVMNGHISALFKIANARCLTRRKDALLGFNEKAPNENALAIVVDMDDTQTDVKMNMASCSLYIDAEAVKGTLQCFDPPSKRERKQLMMSQEMIKQMATKAAVTLPDDTDEVIQQKCKSRKKTNITVDLQPFVVVCPAEEDSQQIMFKLDGLSVECDDDVDKPITDPSMCYNEYQIHVKNFGLYFGDEVGIAPVSTDVFVSHSFIRCSAMPKYKVNLEIPNVDIGMTQKQCTALKKLPSLLSRKTESDEPVQPVVDQSPKPFIDVHFGLKNLGLLFKGTASASRPDAKLSVNNVLAHLESNSERQSLDLSIHDIKIANGEKVKISTTPKEGENSIVVQFGSNDCVAHANVLVSRPVVHTSFEWVWRLKDFVIPPAQPGQEPVAKEEAAPDNSKPPVTVSVAVTDPEVVLGLHGMDHRHHLSVNFESINVDVEDAITAKLARMIVALDGRHLTKETDIGIMVHDGVIHGELACLEVMVETLDYRFFMDLLGYYRVYMPSTQLPDILTDEDYKWTKIVRLHEIRGVLSENGERLYDVDMSGMLVRMSEYDISVKTDRLYVAEYMVTKEHEERVLLDSDGFVADVYNDRKVVLLKPGAKVFAKLVPLNFLFNLVIYPTGLKERLLKYKVAPDTGEFVTLTFVEPEFHLMPPGKNFGVLTTDDLVFKFMRTPGNVSVMQLDFQKTKAVCDHMGAFHDFLSWDAAKMSIRLPRIDIVFYNGALALQYDLFMETIRYLLALIATEPPKPGPYSMPPYFYNVYFDRLLLTSVPRRMDDRDYCIVFDLQPFSIVTGETPDILLIDSTGAHASTVSGERIATIEDFHLEEHLVQFDPEVLNEEQRNSESLFIRQFLTKLHMKSCDYVYRRKTMDVLLAVMQSFFAQELPKRDEPDPFELSFDSYITIDRFDMTWFDTSNIYICTMNARGFDYRVFTEQDVAIKDLEIRTNDYLWAECDKTLETPAVKWKKGDNFMTTLLDRVTITLDYVACGRLTTEVMISPILTFRVRPPAPDEQPDPEYYTSYVFSNSEFIFPVDPPEKTDALIMQVEEFIWSMKNDWQYEAKNLVAMFSPGKGQEAYLPLVKIPSLKYHNAMEPKGRVYILAASAFDMKIDSVDIVSFLLIWQNINKMRYQYSWESTPDDRVVEHTRFILHMDRFSVSLSESNRYVEDEMTLLRFSFDPSRSSFPLQINTADVEPSVLFVQLSPILYMNPETGLPDEITEAVKVRFEIRFHEDETKIKIDFCEDINMNFSFKALNHILAFTNEVSSRIATNSIEMKPRPRFSVVNRTGARGFFKIGSMTKEMEGLEQMEVKMSEMTGSDPICYSQQEGDTAPFTVYPANLQYPSFINRSIVVFAKRSAAGQVVKFSSLVRFKNNLTRTMYLLARQETKKFRIIAEIPVGKSQGFPVSEPLNGNFALTDNKDNYLTTKHDTFGMKKVRKRCVIIKCYIKGGCYELLLRPKRNETTFVLTIEIEALVVAINRLPFEVKLTLGDKPKRLPIDVPVSLPKINYKKPFLGTITRREFGKMVTISTDVDDTTEILFGVEQVVSVAVDAVKQENSPQIQLIFYAPLIVFNRSSQSLSICDVQITKMVSFQPRVAESNIDDDGLLLWGTHSYFLRGNKRSLAIRVAVAVDENSTVIGADSGGHVFSDVIETLTLDTDKQLLIANPAIDDTYIALHYSLHSAQPYAKSKVLTLFSQIHVVNKLPYSIFLQPVRFDDANKPIAFGLPAKISSDESVPIHSSGSNFCFGLFSELSPFPVTIDFTKPRHQTMISRSDTGPLFIDYQIDDRGVEVLATFQNAIIEQPLMLANTLDIDISYWQFSVEQHVPVKIHVPSNTTTIVGLEDPHVFTTITVCILDKQIHVDLKNRSVKTQQFPDFTVNVEVRPSVLHTQVIYVSYARDAHEQEKKRDFTMKMSIPSIRVSLIDDYPREFMLFSMRHIMASYFSNETLDTFNVFVHAIQLDDLHPLATYPVAVVGVAQNNHHFIEFRCSSFANAPFMTHFDNISIRMQTLYTFIDIRFLSDLLTFVMPQQIGTTLIVPPEPLQIGIRNMPVSVDTLTVFNTSFFINSRTSTGRPNTYPLYMSKMRIIPNITKFELVIPFFKSGHGDLSDINLRLLQDAIFHPYMEAIREQLSRILSSIDVLGVKKMVDVSPKGGIGRMAYAQEIQSLASTRVRIPRAMPRKQIAKFDMFTAYIQLMIQKIDNNKRYAKETIQVLIDNRARSDIAICITQNYIFEIMGSQAPQIVKPFFKIKEVTTEIENEKIIVKYESKSLVIPCDTVHTAQVVATYLRSKRLALTIGNL